MEKGASLDPLELKKLQEFISTLPNDSALRSKLIEIVEGDEEHGRNSYEAQIRAAKLPVRGTGDILALAVHCEAKKRGLITTTKKVFREARLYQASLRQYTFKILTIRSLFQMIGKVLKRAMQMEAACSVTAIRVDF